MKTENKYIIIPDFMILLKSLEHNETKSISDIHRETKITYSHVHGIKNMMLNKGWISQTSVEEDKKKILLLTEKGKSIVLKVNSLLEEIGITDFNIVEFQGRRKHKKKEELEVGENENNITH